jgi:transcriptional regulator with XRE-family HTH domain
MKLGPIIKQRRLELGMSQEALGLAAGTDGANISRIERNQQSPSIELLTQIAVALKMTLSELIRRAEEAGALPQAPQALREAGLPFNSLASLNLLRSFDALEPRHQKLVREMIRSLARIEDAGD